METGPIFNLDQSISDWRRKYTSRADFWPSELDELESHLREHVEELLALGVDPQDAFDQAAAKTGSPSELADIYRDNRYADSVGGQAARLSNRIFPALLHNYVMTATRSIRRTGMYSFISSFGLSVALACCIWILIFVGGELGHDTFHSQSEHIARLTKGNSANTSDLWAPEIARSISGIKDYVRVRNDVFNQAIFNLNNDALAESAGILADASFFRVFSFTLDVGDPETALVQPFSIVLSRKLVEKYDLPDDPRGEIVDISGISNSAVRRSYVVTGVVSEPAGPSHIQFDYALSYSSIEHLNDLGEWGTPLSWVNRQLKSYFVFEPGVDRDAILPQISALIRPYISNERFLVDDIQFQDLTSIHLNSQLRNEFPGGGNISYVYLLAGLALAVLILAMVNFVNLATARSVQRSKEVGMRKAIGASSSQIRSQYVMESVIMSFISLLGALLLAFWMRDFVIQMTLKDLSLTSLIDPIFAGSVLLVTLLTGLAAGFYPAMILSRYQAVDALKPGRTSGGKMSLLRKGLVAFQFTVSIGLVATTLVMASQMKFVADKPLGYESENVIVVRFGHSMRIRDNIESVLTQLRSNSQIEDVSASHSLPSHFLNTFSYLPEGSGPDETVSLGNLALDTHLLDLLQVEFIAGRSFTRDSASDSLAFILNESGARALGWDPDESILGKTVEWTQGSFGFTAPVIGLVKDFHYGSLRQEISPIIFNLSRFGNSNLLVKVRPENAAAVLTGLESTWATYESDFPFNFSWLDDRLASQYVQENRLASLFSYTAVLALLIACLGLFSMASFATKNRTKEIGIRKTLGARTSEIVLSFAREYAVLLLIALLAAVPLTTMAINNWLDSFAYRIDLGVIPFLGAALVVFVVASVSVASQTYRAAVANPTISLRSS